MRVMLRLLGLDLLDFEITTDSGSDDSPETPPRTFGFHASGTGVIERADDAPPEPSYDDRTR